MNTIFHLAFKVKDIESTLDFYNNILGCKTGRVTSNWIDFDFFGHQLSAHISANIPKPDYCGKVDKLEVPIPHFGCILKRKDFDIVKKQLLKHHIEFLVKPQIRYKDKKGEQQTMFVFDYSYNAIEFKTFKDKSEIF